MVLWRELNYVKIPQGDAKKSANLWGILRVCGSNKLPPHDLTAYLKLIHIKRYFVFVFKSVLCRVLAPVNRLATIGVFYRFLPEEEIHVLLVFQRGDKIRR
jgi:hypothetical protein